MDKTYLADLAGDIFNMIDSAKQSGLDLQHGFQSTPLNGPHIFLNYLFQPKSQLKNIPGMPSSFRRRLKKSNVLATIDVGKTKVGIFALCALDKRFDKITSAEDVAGGMIPAEVETFGETLREVLKADLEQQTGMAPQDDDKDAATN